MTLYLIRHAHAGTRDPNDPDDHLRPLSRKGQKQAQALAAACTALDLRFDRLFTSPYTRAAETAGPLTSHTREGRLELLAELTGDDYAQLLEVLRRTRRRRDRVVALVGHEPYLGELLSYLLCGAKEALSTHFSKGMLVRVDGPLRAGQLELRSALPPALLKRLG
jgi:phosphohistidine phosphatase